MNIRLEDIGQASTFTIGPFRSYMISISDALMRSKPQNTYFYKTAFIVSFLNLKTTKRSYNFIKRIRLMLTENFKVLINGCDITCFDEILV